MSGERATSEELPFAFLSVALTQIRSADMALHMLPVELVQAIAHLAAPATACELQILDSNRRRFLVALATLSRSLHYALRPMIWHRV